MKEDYRGRRAIDGETETLGPSKYSHISPEERGERGQAKKALGS